MSIEIKDVCLTIDDTPNLHNISLTLSGGMVGVLGPNGAGKTTLLRVISGYLRPRQGTVRLDGGDVGALGAKALAKKWRSYRRITLWNMILPCLRLY